MNCKGTQGQTALEFYLGLNQRTEEEPCVGPLVYLDLMDRIVEVLGVGLSQAEALPLLRDAYIAPIRNKNFGRFGSCAAHWLDMVSISMIISENTSNRNLRDVSSGLLYSVCSQCHWDYRELDNYLKSNDRLN